MTWSTIWAWHIHKKQRSNGTYVEAARCTYRNPRTSLRTPTVTEARCANHPVFIYASEVHILFATDRREVMEASEVSGPVGKLRLRVRVVYMKKEALP